MQNGHGGVVMGSEISGGIKNVFVDSCQMDSPELDRAIRVKTNSNRGGVVENIYVRNLKIGQVREAILLVDCVYDIINEGVGTFYPVIRNVNLANIECNSSKYALLIEGIQNRDCVYDIHVSNSDFEGVVKGNSIKYGKDISFDNVKINGRLTNLKD